MAFDPSSIIAGGISLGSSIAGAISSNRNTKRYIEAQREENEKNRVYNKELAAQSNAWNIEQWSRENEYNDPTNQMARLRKAGLNPDLVYGGSAPSGMAASSPQLTAGAPSSPSDMSPIANKKSVADYLMQSASVASLMAQTKKTEAETAAIQTATTGQKSQNSILASDAAFRDGINSGSIKLNAVNIANTSALKDLNEGELSKVRTEIANLDVAAEQMKQAIEESRARVANMSEQQLYKRCELALADKRLSADIERMGYQNNLTAAETRQLVMMLPGMLVGQSLGNANTRSSTLKNFSEIGNNSLKAKGISLSNEGVDMRLNDSRRYNTELNSMGLAGNMVRCTTELINRIFGGSIGKLVKP